jgi:hypothetical protein
VRVELDDDLHRAEPEGAHGELRQLHPRRRRARGDVLAEGAHLLGVARSRGLELDRPAVQPVADLDPVERPAPLLEVEGDVLGDERGEPLGLEPGRAVRAGSLGGDRQRAPVGAVEEGQAGDRAPGSDPGERVAGRRLLGRRRALDGHGSRCGVVAGDENDPAAGHGRVRRHGLLALAPAG